MVREASFQSGAAGGVDDSKHRGDDLAAWRRRRLARAAPGSADDAVHRALEAGVATSAMSLLRIRVRVATL